jgi:hypothetical protein
MLRIILCIDYGLYFGTSEGSLDRSKKELPVICNVDFMGISHCYLSARLHQENNYNITIDQSIYSKSIVRRYMDIAGVKRVNSPRNYILPIDSIPTI